MGFSSDGQLSLVSSTKAECGYLLLSHGEPAVKGDKSVMAARRRRRLLGEQVRLLVLC